MRIFILCLVIALMGISGEIDRQADWAMEEYKQDIRGKILAEAELREDVKIALELKKLREREALTKAAWAARHKKGE